jgi:hypothetical protein
MGPALTTNDPRFTAGLPYFLCFPLTLTVNDEI